MIGSRRPISARHVALAAAAIAFAAAPAATQIHGKLEKLTSSGTVQARFVEDRDHISIVELAGNYDKVLADGTFNAEPRTLVAREFYLDHPDSFDFLVVFSSFEFRTSDPESGEVLAFHVGVQNQTEGIGLPLFDNTALFGSDGRLLGYVDMAALTRYATDPLAPDFELVLGTMAHEVMHQWCCFVDHLLPDGTESRGLIGRGDAHWSFLLSSGASVMYGHDWRDNGDGTFTAVDARRFYGPLDLYLAGFFSPEEVAPLQLIENPGIDVTRLPRQGITVDGSSRLVSVDDVVAAEGPRVPPAGEAQELYRAAFVLLVRPGETVTSEQVAALGRIRDAFQTRFSVLTGGRGIFQVFPEARLDVEPGAPDPVSGGAPRPGEASIPDALAWLRSRQSADGFWEDTAATRVRDTSVSLQALADLDPSFAGGPRGLGWLGAETASNTDDLARQIAALAREGQDASLLRAELRDRQNQDGGWGLGRGYRSDPMDTALAALALAGDAGGASALAAAGGYLVGNQNADGGWGSFAGGPSRIRTTTSVLLALDTLDLTAAVGDGAIGWLASRQNADGGFGDSPSTAHDTAAALRAAIALDALVRIDAEAAGSFLRSRQTFEGSWDGSTFTTASVVDALQRSVFPNWSFQQAPTASPPAPRDGERVEITVRIANDGAAIADGGVLRLFDGDPDAGDDAAAPDVALPTLPPGRTATLTLFWDTFDRPGPHTLVAVLDPDGAVTELSELDNRISFDIEVAPAPVEADLEVRSADLVFTPAAPDTLPTALGVSVLVRNLGQTDVPDGELELLLGDPDTGIVLGTRTASLPQRSTTVVNFSYPLETAGVTTFSVRLDPADRVAEANESNNVASRSVETVPTVDLESLDGDIELLEGAARLGQDASFRVALRNRGTVDAPGTEVRYFLTDGTTETELARNPLQLAAGESVVQTIVWRVDRLGDLTFVAELDPLDVVPETDETNNLSSLSFSAVEIEEVNLTLGAADLTVEPEPALEGKPATLRAAVRNTGASPALDVEVAFFDGNPDDGGVLIEGRQLLPTLDAGASATVELLWPAIPDAADRLVFVVLDPDDSIPEFDEGDNSTFKVLEVLSLPDLAISPAALQLQPRFPRPGESVTLTVSIANLGEQAASNVLVRAFDGDPLTGGLQVGGDQTVPAVGGLAGAVVTFSFDFTTGSPRPIVVIVDPGGDVDESSTANNSARLDVAVQDGDFFVSERYFSPNGDSVKDATQFFYRFDQPEETVVEVLDLHGDVVRSSATVLADAGDFLWDGLDRRGRVARDGDYRLVVRRLDGTILGEAPVSLDTDRSSLIEAAESPYELFSNLTCELPQVENLQLTADEEFFYFSIFTIGDPLFPRGIYRMGSSGADIQQLVTSDFFLSEYATALRVTADGRRIAFERGFAGNIFVADGLGNGIQQVNDLPTTDIIDFAQQGESLVVVRYDGRYLLELIPLDGFSPRRTLYSSNGFFWSYDSVFISPDQQKLVLRDSSRLVLIDIPSGANTTLDGVNPDFNNRIAWSPTARRFAVTDRYADSILIYNRQGELERAIDVPVEPYPPELLDDFFGSEGEPQVDYFDTPSWSRSGEELTVAVGFFENFDYSFWTRIFRVDVVSADIEEIGLTTIGRGESYTVETWDGTAWVERGTLHYDLFLSEQSVDLTGHLPDPDGELKVRVRQHGHEAAHVDSVSLRIGDIVFLPSSARRLGSSQDVTTQVSLSDFELVDLHERGLELHWDDVPADQPLRLTLVAREETLSTRRVRPFRFPARPADVYNLRLVGDGSLVVDGRQTASDQLGDALFSSWAKPGTGHPGAVVSGWAKSDGDALYAALDFTVDNTEDGDLDWAALAVETTSGWRQFRVGVADGTWGKVGFVHTGAVHHTHKYYEFRIPLTEIEAQEGDVLRLAFEAYGTAAIVDEESDLLYPYGQALWVPNERTVLWTSGGYGRPNVAILLDEGNRRRDLFTRANSFQVDGFSASGRRMLFRSSDETYDPVSPCYLRGFEDNWTFQSLLNLTSDLRARRSASVGGVLLEGTAADRHLAQYRLDYAPASAPTSFNPITPAADETVVDGRFTTWIPPAPGSYLVRLRVEDLAGNRRDAIRRVSWANTPSITDLYRTPQFISPNGDGVKDFLTIGYRVLQPVHLEFSFFNDNGDRVRTLVRDHPTTGPFELRWDGRNDRGLPVADGEYRMTVQNFEFFLHVDSTPPEIELSLENAYQPDESLNAGVDPALRFRIIESNPDGTGIVETGVGADPTVWLELGQATGADDGDDFLRRPLELFSFIDHRFRIEARDLAGNHTLVSTPLGDEELIVNGFGTHELAESGAFEPLGPVPFVPPGVPDGDARVTQLSFGDVRFAVTETVRRELFQLSVQFRPLDQPFWQETPIDLFLRPGLRPGAPTADIPDMGLQLVWDLAGVPVGTVTVVRLRAVDIAGGEHFSNSFRFVTDGVFFGGPVTSIPPPPDPIPQLVSLAREQRLFGDDDVLLWATEFVAEPLAEIRLQVRSDEDPRFANWTLLEPILTAEGGMLFKLEDAAACKLYDGFVTVVTEPVFSPAFGTTVVRSIDSNRGQFQSLCLDVDLDFAPVLAAECGGPSPNTIRFDLVPRSAKESPLQLLTLARVLDDGTEDILFSVNRPTKGGLQRFDLDTTDIPEGRQRFVVRLSDIDDDTTDRVADVDIDHTPPDVAINFPLEGQRLCGVPREIDGETRNVFDVEGLVDDAVGADYDLRLFRGASVNGTVFAEEGIARDALGAIISRFNLKRKAGTLGTYADNDPVKDAEGPFTGDALARLEVRDWGGFRTCAEVEFFFDGAVEGARLRQDRRIFSPNADGVLDEVSFELESDELSVVDVEIFPGRIEGRDVILTGPSVVTLVSQLQILDLGSAVWDGFDAGNQVVPDGTYVVVATFEDACGNRDQQAVQVEVDTTPPSTEIVFPRSGDPLTMILEVIGSADDENFQAYALDFGVGPDPETFARLGTGARPVSAEVLGVWNTFGLEGDFTLRLLAKDVAGNEAESRVELFFATRINLISYFETEPRLFSPNGDGRRESAAVRFGLDVDSIVTLQVLDIGGALVRTLADGSALGAGAGVRSWDGLTNAGAAANDGTYVLRLFAALPTNANVNQEEKITVALDRTAPLVAITRPTAGFSGGRDDVIGTIDDPLLKEWVISLTDDPTAPAWVEIARGTVPRRDAALGRLDDLADGEYALRFEAEDSAENRTVLVVPFEVDNTAPKPALSAPVAGSFLSATQGPAPVTGTVDEKNLAAFHVELGAGSEPAVFTEIAMGTSLPPSAGGDPQLALWDVAALADGAYTLRLRASDRAGNEAETRVLVIVDNTPPEVAITDPADGGFVIGTQAITGTASDDHLTEYTLAVAPGARSSATQYANLGSGVASVTQGTLHEWRALPPDGIYTLRLLARDAAKNEASTLVELTVDLTPPAKPQGLVAQLVGDGDGQLDWQPNSETDLAGYFVERDGDRLNETPVPSPAYLDPGLLEGTYLYRVLATDRAGNTSEPSDPAELDVDLTPPEVRIQRPANATRVSGLVDVKGTAFSQDDFKEYRLFVERSGSGAPQLLRRSPVAVQADVLAQWNTLVLPEDEVFVLRLEGEDLTGNVGVVEVTVTIDNLPPAAPTGLAASVTGAGANDVRLGWNANTEDDLLGYLLFRDGRLANADSVVVGDLRPFVIKDTSYLDRALADGLYSYEVFAIDEAGNLSDPSNAAEAEIETRPPAAFITSPEDGSEFDINLHVLADSEDTDIARVQFQFKAAMDATWADLGPPDTELPWETSFDPAALGLTFDDYDLRAVATDRGGLTDAAPESIRVTFIDLTRPAAVTDLAAVVDGGDVTLSWTANAEPDLEGYFVVRRQDNGSPVRITGAPVTDTSFVDAGLADALYHYTVIAVDTSGNEADPSNEADAPVTTPELEQPFTPTRSLLTTVRGRGPAEADVEAEVSSISGSAALPAIVSDVDGAFELLDVPLEPGENFVSVRLADAAGNRTKAAEVRVVVGEAPSAPTGVTATTLGPFDVEVSWNQNPEPEVVGYRVLRNDEPMLADQPVDDFTSALASSTSFGFPPPVPLRAIDDDPATFWSPYPPIAGESIEVSLPAPRLVLEARLLWQSETFGPEAILFAAADYDLEVWDGQEWVPMARVRGNAEAVNRIVFPDPYRTDRLRVVLRSSLLPEFSFWAVRLAEIDADWRPLEEATTVAETLPDGEYSYTVTAVSDLGFEGPPSAPAALVLGAPIVLSATVSLSDASLTWTAATDPDLAFYAVYRDGVKIAEVADLASRTFVDVGRPNGTYRYKVRPVNSLASLGAPSNEVEVLVDVPPPPPPALFPVTGVPEGAALDLAWEPAAGSAPAAYEVRRATTSGGPYQAVTQVAGTAFRDVGLANGVTYYYVVAALDAIGNTSLPSNEEAGTPGDAAPPPAPILHLPGFAGIPFATRQRALSIGGSAEPGTEVTVLEGGSTVGRATARAELVTESSPLFVFDPVHLAPDGRHLWIEDFPHRLYDFDSGEESSTGLFVSSPRWSADSSLVYVVEDYRTVQTYRLADGAVEDLVVLDGVEVALPAPDGSRLAVLGERQGFYGLWLYTIATDSWRLLLDDAGFTVYPDSLRWLPDGGRVLFGRYSGGVELVDAASGEIRVLDGNSTSFPADVSADGRYVLEHIDDFAGLARIELATGSAEILAPTPAFVDFARFSPSGERVLLISGTDLLELDPASATTESLASSFDPVYDFQVAASGDALWIDGYEPQRLRLAGAFQLRAVGLRTGDNVFSAEATDEAGNLSPRSTAMTVTLLVDDRPDLAVATDDVAVLPPAALAGQTVRLNVTVHNRGVRPAPSSALTVRVLGPGGFAASVADEAPVPPLAPQASATLAFDYVPDGPLGTYTVAATVDPRDVLAEVSEINNRAESTFEVQERSAPSLTIVLDRSEYLANDDVLIHAEVFNGGDTFDGRLAVGIEDGAGVEVASVLDAAVAGLPFSQVQIEETEWSTGTTFSGGYVVHGRLFDATGNAVDEAAVPFEILEQLEIEARLVSDRASYVVGAAAELQATVRYVFGNTPLDDAEVALRILDPAGGEAAAFTRALGELLPEAESSTSFTWSSASAAPGTHRASLEVLRAGATLAVAETFFELLVEPPALSGALALADTTVAVGPAVAVGYSVTNPGSEAIPALPIIVSLRDPAGPVVLASEQVTADLAPGATFEGSATFATAALTLKTYLLVLEIEISGGGGTVRQILDSLTISTVDETPPQVTVVAPTPDDVLGSAFEAVARAFDGLSTVDRVELQLDGALDADGEPLYLPADSRNPQEGLYSRPFSQLAEGQHALRARARDRFGNEGTSAEVPFVVDLTPPQILVTGVEDGLVYPDPVTPVVVIVEVHPDFQSITLDGEAFVSGTEVAEPGLHLLEVAAEDQAGNRAERQVSFELAQLAVELAVGDTTVVEGDTASFVLNLSEPLAEDVTIDFGTVDGTAVAGLDYVESTGSVILPAGETSGEVQVPTLDDSFADFDETFLLQVTTASTRVDVVDGTGVVTILDDGDPRVLLTKRDTPDEAPAGGEVRYDIEIRSNTDATLEGLVLTDPIPAGTSLVAGSVMSSQGAAGDEDPVQVDLGALAPEAIATVSFSVRLDASLGVFSEVVNQAELLGTDLDAVRSDDPDTVEAGDPTRTFVLPIDGWGFVETGTAGGIALDGKKIGGIVLCDVDGDGFLDLMVHAQSKPAEGEDDEEDDARAPTAKGDKGNGGNDGGDDDDEDGDGEDDGSPRNAASRLFFNNGDGTFRDVTDSHAFGLREKPAALQALCGDLDNDGLADLLRSYENRIEVFANQGPQGDPPWSVGDDKQRATQKITHLEGGLRAAGMGLLDADGDGDLDLVVDNGRHGIDLLSNDGSGELRHVTPDDDAHGLPIEATSGDYLAVADLDDDGWVDVLARMEGELDLWQNRGDGTFTANVTFDEETSADNTGGVALCDFDGDGDLDAFWSDAGENQIWRNFAGTFESTGEPGLSSGVDLSISNIDAVACGDVDSDGRVDLFLGDEAGPSFLFLNRTVPGSASPLAFVQDNRGIDVQADVESAVFGDVDRDGDLDLLLNLDGAPNQLWRNGRNDTGQDNQLAVRALRCLPGGRFRDDIGATVRLFAEDGFTPVGPLLEVNGGRGHGSQDPAWVSFGLARGRGATYVVEVHFRGGGGVPGPVVRRFVVPEDLLPYAIVEVNDCGASDRPPLAFDLAATTKPGSPVTVTLVGLDPEGHPLLYTISGEPLHGTLSFDGRRATYAPDAGFRGDDAFTYRVSDGVAQSTDAVVRLTVKQGGGNGHARTGGVASAEGER